MDTDPHLNTEDPGEPKPKGCSWGLITVLAIFFLVALYAVIDPTADSHPGKARRMSAKMDVQSFSTALSGFQLLCGRCPTTMEGLAALVERPADIPEEKWERQIDRVPLDPWGHAYVYHRPGVHHPDSYDHFSVGRDGKPDTDDDIVAPGPPPGRE